LPARGRRDTGGVGHRKHVVREGKESARGRRRGRRAEGRGGGECRWTVGEWGGGAARSHLGWGKSGGVCASSGDVIGEHGRYRLFSNSTLLSDQFGGCIEHGRAVFHCSCRGGRNDDCVLGRMVATTVVIGSEEWGGRGRAGWVFTSRAPTQHQVRTWITSAYVNAVRELVARGGCWTGRVVTFFGGETC